MGGGIGAEKISSEDNKRLSLDEKKCCEMNKIAEQQTSDDKNSTKVKSEESTKKNGNNDVKKPEQAIQKDKNGQTETMTKESPKNNKENITSDFLLSMLTSTDEKN